LGRDTSRFETNVHSGVGRTMRFAIDISVFVLGIG
jgi:hypothetical protein